MAAGSDTIAEGASPPARGGRGDWRVKLLDRAPFIVACIMLVVLWHVITKHYLQVEWRLPVPLH